MAYRGSAGLCNSHILTEFLLFNSLVVVPSCHSFVSGEMQFSLLSELPLPQTGILVMETSVKHSSSVCSWFFFSSAELPSSYSEEEFDSPVAQDPTGLTEDTQVPAARDAPTEDGDDELECAKEEQ